MTLHITKIQTFHFLASISRVLLIELEEVVNKHCLSSPCQNLKNGIENLTFGGSNFIFSARGVLEKLRVEFSGGAG